MRVLDLLVGTDEKRRPGARDYLIAFAAVAIALCFQSLFWAVARPFPLLFYFPAICVAALHGGFGPGAVAALLSALCIFCFAWPGLHGARDWSATLPFAAYGLVAAACILTLNAMRNAILILRKQNDETAAQLRDANDRAQALRHQMTNNMQVVASLLTLQKMKLKTDPWAAGDLLDNARQRVVDMSRISRLLSERTTAAAGFRQYLQLLCADLQSSTAISSHEIVSSVPDDFDISDPGKLMALSVLIGEAVNNALKHAFREPQGGQISVAVKRLKAASCQLTVDDNGHGLPDGTNIEAARSGGFLVMRAMTVQLGGKIKTPPMPQGTRVLVTFDI